MRFTDIATKHLENCCLSQEHIEEVIKLAHGHEAMTEMKSRWSDDADGYPKVMSNIFIRLLNSVALEWVDELHPQAFFRPMFLPPNEQEDFIKANS